MFTICGWIFGYCRYNGLYNYWSFSENNTFKGIVYTSSTPFGPFLQEALPGERAHNWLCWMYTHFLCNIYVHIGKAVYLHLHMSYVWFLFAWLYAMIIRSHFIYIPVLLCLIGVIVYGVDNQGASFQYSFGLAITSTIITCMSCGISAVIIIRH